MTILIDRDELPHTRHAHELVGMPTRSTLALRVVRAQERGDVSSIIDKLEGSPEVAAYRAAQRPGQEH
jgi:hypothetical protein